MSLAIGVVLIAQLTSCGFEPLYAEHNQSNKPSVKRNMIATIVTAPNTKEGQILQYAIQDLFSPRGETYNPKFRLASDLLITVSPVIIDQTGENLSYNVTIKSPFTLVDIETQEIILNGKIKREVSYSASDVDFSTYVSLTDAKKQGIEEVAKAYEKKISVFFASNN